MKSRTKPIHIISGFLGSGKTTLLNRLLKLERFSRTLVIVNEFGEISLDHHLFETSTETIYELSNGCLCCSIRGELVETLASLESDSFDRIIIETTGIADPLPVFQSLSMGELTKKGLRPGAIVSVFETGRGKKLVETHAEAMAQIAIADLVFVRESDVAPLDAGLETFLNSINPAAQLVSELEDIDLDHIGIGSRSMSSNTHHEHSGRYGSILLQTPTEKPLAVWVEFLDYLARTLGPDLLRIKGFVACPELDGPVLVQTSGNIIHQPEKWNSWPAGTSNASLVVITKKIDPKLINTAFMSFLDIPSPDQPDRAALSNNPLSIPGY